MRVRTHLLAVPLAGLVLPASVAPAAPAFAERGSECQAQEAVRGRGGARHRRARPARRLAPQPAFSTGWLTKADRRVYGHSTVQLNDVTQGGTTGGSGPALAGVLGALRPDQA